MLFAFVAFFFFATHDVLVKTAGQTLPVFQIIFLINILAFFPGLLLVLSRQGAGALVPRRPGWVALRAGLILSAVSCAFFAFTTLPLAEAYVLMFAAPLIMTLMAVPVLGERVGARRLTAILVGLIGVLIVLRPGFGTLSFGHLAALGTAFLGASAGVVVRKIGRQETLAVMVLSPMVVNLAVVTLFVPGIYQPVSWPLLGAVAGAAVLFTSAQILMVQAFRRAPAARVAPAQYSQILWAVLYGALFFGEFPDIWVGVGAAVVIGSGVYIVLREEQIRTTSTRPASTAPKGWAVPQMGGRQGLGADARDRGER